MEDNDSSSSIWKFVNGASPTVSSNCELYHFYDAKNVHKRSIEHKGVKTIWRHFLRWNHESQELSYYDGREDRTDGFNYVINNQDTTYDSVNKKIYINIQPRDMLIWTWCYDEKYNTIELRQWEKKLCKFCDKKVKIHKNGCYDFNHVSERHVAECPYKNMPKFGLQNKYYYLHYDLDSVLRSPPKDLRRNINPFEIDEWSIVINNKEEFTESKKYIKSKTIKNPYDVTRQKDEQEKKNSIIRELINKANYDNIELIVKELQTYKEDYDFILKYLFDTYKTLKEYPHVDIIIKLGLEKDILNLFEIDFYSNKLDENQIKSLKYKVCMLNNIYNKKLLSVDKLIQIFDRISTPKHVEILIYFFVTDSKFGFKIGQTIDDLSIFKKIIKKMMTYYDEVSTKTQFALDDIS